MLKLYENFPGTSVLSLRVGRPVAVVIEPIINPNNLFIEAWRVQDNQSKAVLVLLTQDIRDLLTQGLAIDDFDVLTEEKDLIRLQETIKLKFKLEGLKVKDENGQSYGKVIDFAFEAKSFYIKKIYAAQPLVKSISGNSLTIDRTQILEITDREIIIEAPIVKETGFSPITAS